MGRWRPWYGRRSSPVEEIEPLDADLPNGCLKAQFKGWKSTDMNAAGLTEHFAYLFKVLGARSAVFCSRNNMARLAAISYMFTILCRFPNLAPAIWLTLRKTLFQSVPIATQCCTDETRRMLLMNSGR